MTGSASLDLGRSDLAPLGSLPSSPDGLAVFLDVDGTLLDFADMPDEVVVPQGLAEDLARLRDRLGGALALVSGRGISYLRTLFPALPCAMAGLHGVEIAWGDGTDAVRPRSPDLRAAKAALSEAARAWPGVLVEDKGAAFAAHYRLAPGFAPAVEEWMRALAGTLGDGVTMQRGKCVIEIRPSGHDKGTALAAMMARAPFDGRRPVAIGDDLTDEAMFPVADRLGGLSVKVGPGATAARLRVPAPSDVRAWIRSIGA
jgi:trehalose 6-phosphate phosphatase